MSFSQALKAGSAQKNSLPTGPSILLTPALFLDHFEPLLLPQAGLLLLLVLPALVEVLHDDADEHVEDEEADDEQEGDEVEEHPGVVVPHGLRRDRRATRSVDGVTEDEVPSRRSWNRTTFSNKTANNVPLLSRNEDFNREDGAQS